MSRINLAVLMMLPSVFSACIKKTQPIGSSRCSTYGPVEVYKTKADHHDHISVGLTDGKLTSYPGPRDAAGQRPIALANGYWLKLMTGNSFTDITFDAYTDTANRMDASDLIAHVVDTDPFVERWQCCDVVTRDTNEVNNLIRQGKLATCKNIK